MAETDLEKARAAISALGIQNQKVEANELNGKIVLTGKVVADRLKARIFSQVRIVVEGDIVDQIEVG